MTCLYCYRADTSTKFGMKFPFGPTYQILPRSQAEFRVLRIMLPSNHLEIHISLVTGTIKSLLLKINHGICIISA